MNPSVRDRRGKRLAVSVAAALLTASAVALLAGVRTDRVAWLVAAVVIALTALVPVVALVIVTRGSGHLGAGDVDDDGPGADVN